MIIGRDGEVIVVKGIALVVAMLLLAIMVQSSGCDSNPEAFFEGFEASLDGWQTGADVPDDPNNPPNPVAWSIDTSDERASEGISSAEYFLDGRQDDGTIWLARSFAAMPYCKHRVLLTFDLWSPSESFNTIAKVAAYAGATAPQKEADFDTSEPADQQAGWTQYRYEFDVTPGAAGEVWVAFGISAVWETEMTYNIDTVSITIAEW
jgi:hypothetical protein